MIDLEERASIVLGVLDDIYNEEGHPVTKEDIEAEIEKDGLGPFSGLGSALQYLKEYEFIRWKGGGYIPWDEKALEVQMSMPGLESEGSTMLLDKTYRGGGPSGFSPFTYIKPRSEGPWRGHIRR